MLWVANTGTRWTACLIREVGRLRTSRNHWSKLLITIRESMISNSSQTGYWKCTGDALKIAYVLQHLMMKTQVCLKHTRSNAPPTVLGSMTEATKCIVIWKEIFSIPTWRRQTLIQASSTLSSTRWRHKSTELLKLRTPPEWAIFRTHSRCTWVEDRRMKRSIIIRCLGRNRRLLGQMCHFDVWLYCNMKIKEHNWKYILIYGLFLVIYQ